MAEPRYRTGRHVGRTIYELTDDGEQLIGVMDTPDLAAAFVAAMNERLAVEPAAPSAQPLPDLVPPHRGCDPEATDG